MSYKKLNKEDYAKKRKDQLVAITEKLENGIKELMDSDKYKAYLTTMSKFHNYSFNNSLLIALQRPDASLVKRLDEYLEMALESFKYAYKEKDVARCLRNLGWYMVETGKYKEAMGVYFVSLEYDKESKAAQSELYFIHATNPDVNEPTIDELKGISEQYGFPLGPSMEVVKTAFLYGRFFEEKKNYGIAKYCYGIAYDLTHDKSLKDMIEALPANEE